MQLDTLPGCQKEKKYLRHIINIGKVPHAQLFIDKSFGLGLPLSLAFFRYLHCQAAKKNDACGTCADCLKMNKFSHPDLFFIFPTSSNAIQKQQITWLEFLEENPYPTLEDWSKYLGSQSKGLQIRREHIEQLRVNFQKKAFWGSKKSFLIFLPEQANLVAANAMLKMVEDPTPNTYFAFITHNSGKILPTLSSRMWHITIPKLQNKDTAAFLSNAFQINQKEGEKIAILSKGALNVARALAEGNEESYFKSCAQWLRSAYKHDWKDLDQQSQVFHARPFQEQKSWTEYALNLFHFVLYAYCSIPPPKELSLEEQNFINRISDTLTLEKIKKIIEKLLHLQNVLHKNAYARLAFISCSLHISTIFKNI